jgi:class 3 adenylate cyclase
VAINASGGETGPTPEILTIEDCRLDLAAHVFVDGNGREVPLSRAELSLLAVFVGSPRKVLSRDQLRRAVFGRGAGPDDRSVDMLIVRLRRKIEPNPKAPCFILSVPGVGYKFAVQPQIAEHGNGLATIPLDGPTAPQARDIASRHSEPEKRQLTALSCVLAGLGALADPEDLVGIIQRFQEICTTVVTSWGGVVATAVGDEILALFGYPTGHEDDAERAVHAGLNLVANIGELSSPCGERLKPRIAIATGSALIGENQTVVGEATIMASRLRNISPPNSVSVTANTRKLLGSAFICDNPQWFELEGLAEPVGAYRVTGKRAIESRFANLARQEISQ